MDDQNKPIVETETVETDVKVEEVEQAPIDGPAPVTFEQIHQLRKSVDAVIQEAQALQAQNGRNAGGREIALVITKLQEGKMWAGKILEALGSALPAEFKDEAVKPL